ncbi:MAG: hypothetical protein ACK5LT_09025 [Lachnospirales bacterium]
MKTALSNILILSTIFGTVIYNQIATYTDEHLANELALTIETTFDDDTADTINLTINSAKFFSLEESEREEYVVSILNKSLVSKNMTEETTSYILKNIEIGDYLVKMEQNDVNNKGLMDYSTI